MNETFSLSQEQSAAFKAITTFIENDDASVFILKGYAGTGKTMILGTLARWLKSNSIPFQLLAPTGRAARVLSTKTGSMASTIHRSIYNLRQERITDDDRLEVVFNIATNKAALHCLYIVDEASMISDVQNKSEVLRFGSGKLLSDLISFADIPHTNRKIIFTGDNAQLEPIDMSFSPALDEGKLQERFNIKSLSFTLRTVFRQASENTILKTATELRNEIEKETAQAITIAADNGNIFEESRESLIKLYAKHIRNAKELQMNWVCYTNNAVKDLNKEVRTWLGYLKAAIQEGEILMVIQNNYQNDVFYLNGDLIKVIQVSDRLEKHNLIFNYKDKKKIQMMLNFRDVVIEHYDYQGLTYTVKVLENTLDEVDMELLNVAVFVFCQKRYDAGNKSMSFQQFRLEDTYSNALRISYGYAMTVHKAQGGEWDTVVADLKHPAGKHKRVFQRWAYTAITRAKNTLYVLNPVRGGSLSRLLVQQISKISRIRYSTPEEEPEIFADDPEAYHSFPFLKPVINRFIAEAMRFDVHIDLSFSQYRVRMVFSKHQATTTQDVLYSKKGIRTEMVQVGNPHAELETTVELIAQKAFAKPEGVLAYRPAEAFRADFFDLIVGLTTSLNIKITGFIEAAYQDVFLLHTDEEGSELVCYYNNLSQYTTIEPCSRKGMNDAKLTELAQRLASGKRA